MPEKKNRKGAIEVVESKGKKIPIYLSPTPSGNESFQVSYYAGGKRVRERVATIEEARKCARRKINELVSGQAHVSTFSPRETSVIQDAIDVLRETSTPLSQVAREYAEAQRILQGRGSLADAARHFIKALDEQERGGITPILVPELVEKFMAHLRAQSKSRRYTLDMQARLARIAEAFSCHIGEIRAETIDIWLTSMKLTTGRTKNNYRAAMTTLFSFARKRGHLPRGQKTEAEFSTRFEDKGGAIGIYSADQIRFLLTHISDKFRPFVAIGAFAGLRSAEICRLSWEEVLWNKGYIEVTKAKAKTASRRLVPILPCLHAWLEPYKKSSGPVLEAVHDEFALATQFKSAVDAIVDSAGRPVFKIVPNGLRHSFVTYRLAVLKNAAEVSLEAGNSPKMVFEHYRELKTEKEGNDWFLITPEQCGLQGRLPLTSNPVRTRHS